MKRRSLSEFLNKNWSPSFFIKLPTNIDQTSRVDCKAGSDEKRKSHITQNADSAEELVLSQENARDTDKTGISKTSVHTIVKQKLKTAMRSRCVVNFIFSVVYFECQ